MASIDRLIATFHQSLIFSFSLLSAYFKIDKPISASMADKRRDTAKALPISHQVSRFSLEGERMWH
jgi:hypothetical protein